MTQRQLQARKEKGKQVKMVEKQQVEVPVLNLDENESVTFRYVCSWETKHTVKQLNREFVLHTCLVQLDRRLAFIRFASSTMKNILGCLTEIPKNRWNTSALRVKKTGSGKDVRFSVKIILGGAKRWRPVVDLMGNA